MEAEGAQVAMRATVGVWGGTLGAGRHCGGLRDLQLSGGQGEGRPRPGSGPSPSG